MAVPAGADARGVWRGPHVSPTPPAADTNPRVDAIVAALDDLALATDVVARAVERHDGPALVAANERSDACVEELARLAGRLTDADRPELAAAGVAQRSERLRVAARRNAYLIERAWATDAALMRLLAGLGRRSPETGDYGANETANAYAAPTAPAYLDKGA